MIGIGQELNAERRVRDETARQLTRYRTAVVDREILIERPSLRDEALSIHQIEAGSGAEWIEARWLRREVELGAADVHVETDAKPVAEPGDRLVLRAGANDEPVGARLVVVRVRHCRTDREAL